MLEVHVDLAPNRKDDKADYEVTTEVKIAEFFIPCTAKGRPACKDDRDRHENIPSPALSAGGTMLNDWRGEAVLVTGGTRGIGLATGLLFAKAGAHVYLTHRWGSVPANEIAKLFAEKAPSQVLLQS